MEDKPINKKKRFNKRPRPLSQEEKEKRRLESFLDHFERTHESRFSRGKR